jgi:hypothetical protein
MDIPQAQIPHRIVADNAGHVAKRTEVKIPDRIPQSPTIRNLLQGTLRNKINRGAQNTPNFSRGSSVKSRSDNCGNCGANNSVGSHSGTESDTEESGTRKWASSQDIFRAYSDTLRNSINSRRSLNPNQLGRQNQTKNKQVRFGSLRNPPRNGKKKRPSTTE